MSDFGKKLKEWRERHEYSQGYCVDEVNKKAGSKIVSQAHWSQYEKGLFEPKQKIAGYIKATFKDIDFIESEAIILNSTSNNVGLEELESVKDLKSQLAIKEIENSSLRTYIASLKTIIAMKDPELLKMLETNMETALSKLLGNDAPLLVDIIATKALKNSKTFKAMMTT